VRFAWWFSPVVVDSGFAQEKALSGFFYLAFGVGGALIRAAFICGQGGTKQKGQGKAKERYTVQAHDGFSGWWVD
jgi:hypothetical protein